MSATSINRTPSTVKWLLNERAALAGKHARAIARKSELEEKRARLERKLVSLQQQIEGANMTASQAHASIVAFDATMALVEERLERAAAGEVNAWAGKYGKRGALVAFLEETLRRAAPEPLTMTVLLDLTIQKFGLLIETPYDRRSLKNSGASALRSLLKRHRVEPLHSRGANSHGLWRWVGDSRSSLERLAAQAQELR